jgi:hypothetical protein
MLISAIVSIIDFIERSKGIRKSEVRLQQELGEKVCGREIGHKFPSWP